MGCATGSGLHKGGTAVEKTFPGKDPVKEKTESE